MWTWRKACWRLREIIAMSWQIRVLPVSIHSMYVWLRRTVPASTKCGVLRARSCVYVHLLTENRSPFHFLSFFFWVFFSLLPLFNLVNLFKPPSPRIHPYQAPLISFTCMIQRYGQPVWGSQPFSVSLDRWMKASVGLVLCRPWIMDFRWALQVYVIPFNSHNTERSRLVLFRDEYAANVEWQMQCSSSIRLWYLDLGCITFLIAMRQSWSWIWCISVLGVLRSYCSRMIVCMVRNAVLSKRLACI